MIIKEYRIILPISVEDYRIAHLWTTSQVEKLETGGGEGFEIVINEPREFEIGSGQFTLKILRLASKVPYFLRVLAPIGSLQLNINSRNTYPCVNTTMTNPEYMKDNFSVEVESLHKEDFGELENPHGLTADELQQRQVEYIDFVNDNISTKCL